MAATLRFLPTFVRASGEPWEVSIQYNTWKRRLLAVCETVNHDFAECVAGQFAKAHQRHEAQMAGGNRQPAAEVPAAYKEYEARLVVGLLRILPQDVKSGAVEDINVSISSISLLEELVNVIQPGGKEEVAGLLRYVRNLDPVSSANEALETLRRWRIALNLPPAAPSEALKSLYSLIRNLERKHDALRTRMSLAKLAPQVQHPTEEGVTGIADMIEKGLRQAASDEQTKANKTTNSDALDPTASKGKGKGKQGKSMEDKYKTKQVCPFLNGPRGCTFGDRCHYKHPDKPNQPNPNPKLNPRPSLPSVSACFISEREGVVKGTLVHLSMKDHLEGTKQKIEDPKSLSRSARRDCSTG